jgi:hypothetical protein
MRKIIIAALVVIFLYGFNQPKLWYCYATDNGNEYALIVRATSEADAELMLFAFINSKEFTAPKIKVEKSTTKNPNPNPKKYYVKPIEELFWPKK